ncbi:MAG: glutathione peroxidase [Burkholderiales bacterium]|nr:glutathione peroxidase [Burkholderiales bacterium]
MSSVYDFTVKTGDGKAQSLSKYRGQTLLIVNTASQCGFTPQYEGLQALRDAYHARGFEVLAFPCNQFGAQEPGDAHAIAQFCDLNYHIQFPVFAKIDVNGKHAEPLFQFLKKAAPGLLGSEAIKWNFTKFLVTPDGKVKRYAPQDTPASIAPDIEASLR